MLVDQVDAQYWQLSWDCVELVLTDFFQLKHLILLLGTEVVLGLDLTALDWTF